MSLRKPGGRHPLGPGLGIPPLFDLPGEVEVFCSRMDEFRMIQAEIDGRLRSRAESALSGEGEMRLCIAFSEQPDTWLAHP